MKDPYLRLQELSSELWNERKALDWTRKGQHERVIKKLEKLINEIKSLDFETENKMLLRLNN